MTERDYTANLRTVEECQRLAKNALERGRPDVAQAAQRKAVELQANGHPGEGPAEKDALKAVYAYERALTKKNGRNTRANRTWQMIKRYGILGAVERAVCREAETQGYEILVAEGLQEFCFEAVILRHPASFSEEARRVSQQRMAERK